MAKNVNSTARLQWKVYTIKNCIYLQCTILFIRYVQCTSMKSKTKGKREKGNVVEKRKMTQCLLEGRKVYGQSLASGFFTLQKDA